VDIPQIGSTYEFDGTLMHGRPRYQMIQNLWYEGGAAFSLWYCHDLESWCVGPMQKAEGKGIEASFDDVWPFCYYRAKDAALLPEWIYKPFMALPDRWRGYSGKYELNNNLDVVIDGRQPISYEGLAVQVRQLPAVAVRVPVWLSRLLQGLAFAVAIACLVVHCIQPQSFLRARRKLSALLAVIPAEVRQKEGTRKAAEPAADRQGREQKWREQEELRREERRERRRLAQDKKQDDKKSIRLAELEEQLRIEREARRAQQEQAQLARDDRLCLVCYEEESTHAFTPCGHRVTCASCSQRVLKVPAPTCPMCRAACGGAIRVYG